MVYEKMKAERGVCRATWTREYRSCRNGWESVLLVISSMNADTEGNKIYFKVEKWLLSVWGEGILDRSACFYGLPS